MKPSRTHFAVQVALASMFVFNAAWLVQLWITEPYRKDFRIYYTAAQVVLRHGWSQLYNIPLQRSVMAAIGPVPFEPFITPPAAALIVTPFALLPFPLAYAAWEMLVLVALAIAWYLLAPGRGLARLTWLLVALGLLPVALAIYEGQLSLMVAASVAIAAHALRRRIDWLAGASFAAALLKPHLVLLLPLAFWLCGRRRAAVMSVAIATLVTGLQVAMLGAPGVNDLLAELRIVASVPELQAYGFGAYLPPALAWPIRALIVALTATVAFRTRDLETGVGAAILGSYLIATYATAGDLVMLVVAAWLLCRDRPSIQWLLPAATVSLAEVTFLLWRSPFGQVPILVLATAWLASLMLPAAHGRQSSLAAGGLSAQPP